MSGRTWLRRNRLTLLAAIVWVVASGSAPDSAPVWWLGLGLFLLCAYLDHRRLCRDIDAGRDHWPNG